MLIKHLDTWECYNPDNDVIDVNVDMKNKTIDELWINGEYIDYDEYIHEDRDCETSIMFEFNNIQYTIYLYYTDRDYLVFDFAVEDFTE